VTCVSQDRQALAKTLEDLNALGIENVFALTGDYPRAPGPTAQGAKAERGAKAEDGTGNYLYMIDPNSYAASRMGPYSGVLGPYAVDGTSRYAVTNVRSLWGMQVADLRTAQIITATISDHPPGDAGLLHGIGWSPDEAEVWESGSRSDPHVYIWDMRNPMAPVFKNRLTLRTGRGSHWLTFTINGDYAYIAPPKNSDDATEVFDARTHSAVGVIGSSEDMLEIDFADGRVSRVGDQYGIGRKENPVEKAALVPDGN